MTARTLPATGPIIAPSILKVDFGDLAGEVRRLEAAHAKVLHWDVMDGRFVPNLSYGAMVLKSLRGRTNLFYDAHLMIADPAKYLDDYLQAGCDGITFHVEAVPEPRPLLQRIRKAGILAGLALNPKTPVEAVIPALPDCDLVLVMSVEPGFGGQQFIPDVLAKVRRLNALAGPRTILSIDGGIGPSTITAAAEAGARLFVAGSSIFDEPDYAEALRRLESLARSPQPVTAS